MASKVAEANAGVHSLAMAVAVSLSQAIQTNFFLIGSIFGTSIACDQLASIW